MQRSAALLLAAATAMALVTTAAPAAAQSLAVTAKDTVQTVAAAQKGKRVTLRLRSGQELTGVLRETTERLIVLGELSGREFFDAAVPVEGVEAVLVRTKP